MISGIILRNVDVACGDYLITCIERIVYDGYRNEDKQP
nr:MAG TPA: hypothetical protein [Caudoviricetes sp.]